MSGRIPSTVSERYLLEPGCVFVPGRPTLISTLLGSCVSVCLYDRKRKTGGMHHFLLPYIEDKNRFTAAYGNVAVPALVNMMMAGGSYTANLEAHILGGAQMFTHHQDQIGRNNVRMAENILTDKGIRIASKDVGGKKGRRIVFNTSTGEITSYEAGRIRKGKWRPGA